MSTLRPLFSTTVEPREYNFEKQMEMFLKEANKAEESFYSMDVGKLWGLYLNWKHLVSACQDALSDFKFIEKTSPESNFQASIIKLQEALKEAGK